MEITGQTPAANCAEKTLGNDYFLLLPHCSQRIWDEPDSLKYDVKTTFTPLDGWKVAGLSIVTTKYKLPPKTGAEAAEAYEKVVAEFHLIPDETYEEGTAPEREPPDNPLIRVILQTPTIELTLHSPGTFAAKGEEITRPQEELDDSLTVDGEKLKHGYVGIMQVNADNDDGDEIPEPPAAPPRDNDDDSPSEEDNDLVAIKLEVKKPEDFKFENKKLKFTIPDHVRIFGSDKQEISRAALAIGVTLGAGADAGLGEAVANEEVVFYAEGLGVPGEQDAFEKGEYEFSILEIDGGNTLAKGFVFCVNFRNFSKSPFVGRSFDVRGVSSHA